MNGVNLKTIQEIMGHGSFKTTLRYAHLAQDHKRRAMEVFDSHMDTIWTPETEKQKSEELPLSDILMGQDFPVNCGGSSVVEHRPSKPIKPNPKSKSRSGQPASDKSSN